MTPIGPWPLSMQSLIGAEKEKSPYHLARRWARSMNVPDQLAGRPGGQRRR